jgi:hypothetical protein
MKKLLIAIIAFLAISVATVEAQPRAIGTRLGYGVDFSYQHSFGKNMLNFELGVPSFLTLGTAITYDWVFPITSWNQEGTWNWFAGVGVGGGWSWPSLGYWNAIVPLEIDYGGWSSPISLGYWGSTGHAGWVGVAGRIGVEYNFTFPLQLSLDWRPLFGPAFASGAVAFNTGSLYAGAFALGVRYRF